MERLLVLRNLLATRERIITAFLLIAVIGFLASTPRMAGADEPVHQATAWNLASEPLASKDEIGIIPAALVSDPCFSFQRDQDASCLRVDNSGENISFRVTTYPFLYFYTALIGQKIAAIFDPAYSAFGGRLSALLIQMVILLFAYRIFSRRDVPLMPVLLACATSTWIFFATVVNPSSLEILLLFLIGITLAAFSNGNLVAPGFSDRRRLISLGSFALLSLAASASRPIAIVWVILVVALAFLIRADSKLGSKDWLAIILSLLPGALFALYWNTVQSAALRIDSGADPTITDHLTNFFSSLSMTHIRLLQMQGNLGWLDTPMPISIFLLVGAIWTFCYFKIIPRGLWFRISLVIAISIVIIPSMIEAYGYPAVGGIWWQGRYTFPVLAAMLALVLVRYGGYSSRWLPVLLFTNAISATFMLLQNTFRYNFGIANFLPIRLADPALGEIRYYLSLLCIAAMLVLSFRLLKTRVDSKNLI